MFLVLLLLLLLILSSVTPIPTTMTTMLTVDPASCAIRLRRIILDDVLLLLLVLDSPLGGCSFSELVVGFGLLRDRWCYLFVAVSVVVLVAVDHQHGIVPESSNNGYT